MNDADIGNNNGDAEDENGAKKHLFF